MFKDTREMRRELVDDGWLTPDTYCSRFYEVIPAGPAVYLFMLVDNDLESDHRFERGLIAYVGQSIRARARISNHNILPSLNRIPGFWATKWFKPTKPAALRQAEAHYIQKYAPPWNIIGKPRGVVLQ